MDFKKTEKRIFKRTFRKMFMWYVYRFAKRFGLGRVRKWGKTGIFRVLYGGDSAFGRKRQFCVGDVASTKRTHNAIMQHCGYAGTEIDKAEHRHQMLIANGTVSGRMSMKRPNIRNDFDIEVVVDHYLGAMLWSSTDKDDTPLDNEYAVVDVTVLAREKVTTFIQKWLDENKTDLVRSKLDDEHIGHNLWLTTQGHGTGFWDRGLGDVGDRLTEACKPINESYQYAHNGQVYID